MKYIGYILLSALTLVSCVRDEILPCPPLQVNIAVKDKNYFNVDKVELEDRLPDDLPLRDYVPTLYYRLSRIMEDGTSRMVEEKGVFQVEGDGKTHPVTFDESLPHGTYVLTVWGGLDNLEPLTEDRTSISFHPEHTEGLDVYMANDTLVYDAYNYAYTTEMERTKGKLIIQVTNLPTAVHYSDKTITGLYGEMDCCMLAHGDYSVAEPALPKARSAETNEAGISLVDIKAYAKNGEAVISSSETITKVEVVTIAGQVLLAKRPNSTECRMALGEGVNIVKVTTGNGTQNFKLVK